MTPQSAALPRAGTSTGFGTAATFARKPRHSVIVSAILNAKQVIPARTFAGAVPTIYGDINGDGTVNVEDYNLVRSLIGTVLPT